MSTMLFTADRVKVLVAAAPGTGTIFIGQPITDPVNGDCQAFVAAGVPDQAVVSYTLVDGHNWEIGAGLYTASAQSVARGPIASSTGGGAINASANATLAITGTARISHLNVLSALPLYLNSTSGSDSNSGFTPGTAMKTPQAAFNAIANGYDLNGNVVQINLAHGTYPGLNVQSGWTGGGAIHIIGDTASPGSVVIQNSTGSGTDGSAINIGGVAMPGSIAVSGVTLTSGSGAGISHGGAGGVYIGDGVVFGACLAAHVSALSTGAAVRFATSAYAVSGGAEIHFSASLGASIVSFGALACTITNNPAFLRWASAINGSGIFMQGYTFSGAIQAGCAQAVALSNGNIDTATTGSVGPGPSGYFPGSVAPITGSGGQYV